MAANFHLSVLCDILFGRFLHFYLVKNKRILSKKVIIWFLDAGVESLLAVSLGSLRLNAPMFWSQSLKVIIDCGLSRPFRFFLRRLEPEGVCVVLAPQQLAPQLVEEKAPSPGIAAMYQRINVSTLVTSLLDIGAGDHIISCDPDTVFLKEVDRFPFPSSGTDMTIMPGYSISRGREVPTPWLRQATLMYPDLDDADLVYVGRQLRLSAEELQSITSYNAGIFGFCAGQDFSGPWRDAYRAIRKTTDIKGRSVFRAFMAEQNALSLCIHRGQIRVSELPRRFNQFPPIKPLPLVLPADTIILHFVNFQMNHRNGTYCLWYSIRDQLEALGFLPPDRSALDVNS
ncbi:MAG: hypothetical protein H6652_00320 [Ardenticatenaceae bacterium]|nr:hypothetical protein [Ardenticatenaceae bacterium]